MGITLGNTNTASQKNISSYIPPFFTFSLAGNVIVYTPSQSTNEEKYFNHINYKGKNADSGGK